MIEGADGNVWFISTGNDTIGRVTPDGTIVCFGLPGRLSPTGLVRGPDDNLWFANRNDGSIGRITAAGAISTFSDATISVPRSVVAGPDGNLWFVNAGNNSIGRITPAGVVSNFTDPTVAAPRFIVSGPDGKMWFTNFGNNSIGRVTVSGAIDNLMDPAIKSPTALANGPDGNVWFSNCTVCGLLGSIARITPAGAVSTFPTTGSPGEAIVVADGKLWFATGWEGQCGSNCTVPAGALESVTPAGVVAPVAESWIVGGPAAAPDGSVWFPTLGPGLSGGFGRVAPDGTVSYVASASGFAGGITVAADGVAWFGTVNLRGIDDQDLSSIGRIATDGTVTTFAGVGFNTNAVTRGADGNLWVASPVNNSIVRVTPLGVTTAFTDDSMNQPTGIAAGPDGNLWFTNRGTTSIGMITPAGAVSTFADPSILWPGAITAGADGALWFVNEGKNAIGRIATAGTVTTFPDPLPGHTHPGIAGGADGNVWFTVNGPSQSWIGRVSPAGVLSLFADPTIDQPAGIVAGPDGNLWFTNRGNHSIGRITPAGVVANYSDPVLASSRLAAIAQGPDGNLWFADDANATIGEITPGGLVFMRERISHQVGTIALTASADADLWFGFTPSNSNGAVVGLVSTDPLEGPSAPVSVNASPGRMQAAVSWSPPATDGGSPVTGYRVTASPGNQTCMWVSGPLTCQVFGLTAGVASTFTVTATTAVGVGAPSLPSGPVVPWDGALFTPLPPTRVLDSRTSTGGWPGPLVAGTSRELVVTSLGVPSTATAIVANVTVTGATADSFLTVHPTGTSVPNASNLNFAKGQTIANAVTVAVGSGGSVSFVNSVGSVHVIVDVVGYYDGPDGTLFNPVPPARFIDSRGGTGGWAGPLVAGADKELLVAGRGGVPAVATVIVATVTVTAGTAGSFVTVWPSGQPKPNSSSINFAAGQTIANSVTLGLGAGGEISFSNAVGSVHVVVDVVGYYESSRGSRFHAMTPTRALDDRSNIGLVGPWGPGQSRALPIANAGSGVPAGANAVVANVTATNGSAGSFVTVYPDGTARPNASNLNFGPGETIPNLVTAGLSAGGSIDLYNEAGTVDLIADVVGYFAPT